MDSVILPEKKATETRESLGDNQNSSRPIGKSMKVKRTQNEDLKAPLMPNQL